MTVSPFLKDPASPTLNPLLATLAYPLLPSIYLFRDDLMGRFLWINQVSHKKTCIWPHCFWHSIHCFKLVLFVQANVFTLVVLNLGVYPRIGIITYLKL